MHVIATAGHVDHGKSTLVRALTGMEPDRWAEEHRRGMTLDLGFVWTTLSDVSVAFVDVPGHERFLPTMLAGVGPVPAVLLVVAADEGWMPQSEEHLRALDALGASDGILVVTKADSADPRPTLAAARRRLAGTALAAVPAVPVSATRGDGLDELRGQLLALTRRLPAADRDAPVRLWVDRAFTIRGAGTVVTGTLAAGTVRVGDALERAPDGRVVTVRGLESTKQRRDDVAAVARVAVNLRGVERGEVARGAALVSPGRWTWTSTIDVLTVHAGLPAQLVAHIGAAAVPARLRPLGPGAARLQLAAPLPLHLGDRMLLRDPVQRMVARADVADLAPPPLRRRGDAQRQGQQLRLPVTGDDLVARHTTLAQAAVAAAGVAPPRAAAKIGSRWVDPDAWARWRSEVPAAVARRHEPGSAGVTPELVVASVPGLDQELLAALVPELPDVEQRDGRLLPQGVAAPTDPALDALTARLAQAPLDAPAAQDLADTGVTPAALARAVREGRLLRLADGVYVDARAPQLALNALAQLEQPFTVSAARTALGSSRRVVVPLLEHLDASRRTRKLPDGRRLLVTPRA